MKSASAITDDLRRSLGATLEPLIFEVERGAIRRFAEAVGDPNPLYHDEERARQAGYGGVIAPPGFFGWPVDGMPAIEDVLEAFHCPFRRVLNGGTDCEFYRPVQAGDVLTATRRLVDISEREGSLGRMLVLVIETRYVNQDGELVAVNRDSTIAL